MKTLKLKLQQSFVAQRGQGSVGEERERTLCIVLRIDAYIFPVRVKVNEDSLRNYFECCRSLTRPIHSEVCTQASVE